MIPLPMRFESIPLLWTVENVYSLAECQGFIERIERSQPTLATNNPLYRNQDRVIFDDPAIAQDLFSRLRPHLPSQIQQFRLLGVNERLRCYRYAPGQQFSHHMDHWYRPQPNQITLLTVLVYFNSDFEGGDTRFMEKTSSQRNTKTMGTV